MSVWIQNLQARLGDRPVLILHGNVRDKYMDDRGRVHENLTSLLTDMGRARSFAFSELVFYDPVKQELREQLSEARSEPPEEDADADADGGADGDGDADLAATAPGRRGSSRQVPPARVLAKWQEELSSPDQNRLAVLFYLDKLVAYKTSYQEEENRVLLYLEKLIENITPNNRLVLVALQDTMVPRELYTNSPKTYVLPIPVPDKEDRGAYLKTKLGGEHRHLETVADLTDGLFLRDIDQIVCAVAREPELSARRVRELVNKYRIGTQQDYWGALNIDRIDDAVTWFVDEAGVKGQDEAIVRVRDMLCLARAGLSGMASGTPSKPKGVLFFAGPTGVGKTFVAKKLAQFLFGSEDAFLRYDMSEFKEEHTVSKLIGSPPGYVGSERGGMLTNAVRERPFSVILFDEIEKAHPKIMDIFLQLLDDGRLTDSRGQTVFFTETVVIFTSNLGTRSRDSHGGEADERKDLEGIRRDTKLGEEEKKKKVREHFTHAVESFFMFEISRPELLNRIGSNIIPFNYIDISDVQRDIAQTHLNRIKEDIEDRYRSAGHRIQFDPSVAEWLVQRCGDRMSEFGGRGVTGGIKDEVMLPIARSILRAEYEQQQGLTFDVSADRDAGRIVVRQGPG